jgi:hypothetical protein
MTAGGDKLDYPGDASSSAISMLDAKLHINSTISDVKNGARYLGLDIKNFYLGTPMMTYFQYICVRHSIIPQEVWDDHHYTIPITGDGYVYLEIRRMACTASKKPASSLSTNSSKNWNLPDKNPCLSPQASDSIA